MVCSMYIPAPAPDWYSCGTGTGMEYSFAILVYSSILYGSFSNPARGYVHAQ